jgi:hypothetical protein
LARLPSHLSLDRALDELLLHSFHFLAEIMDEIDRTEKTNDKLEKENEMLHVYENNL